MKSIRMAITPYENPERLNIFIEDGVTQWQEDIVLSYYSDFDTAYQLAVWKLMKQVSKWDK